MPRMIHFWLKVSSRNQAEPIGVDESTLNDDAISLRLLPDLDMSNRDKLMIFQCRNGYNFTGKTKALAEAELPAFARWLLDYEMPSDMVELRFGVKAFINDNVQEISGANSKFAHIIELLQMWRSTLADDSWEGTCSELLKVLGANEANKILLKDISTRSLGWGLKHMQSKGFDWVNRSEKLQYGWKISGG